jgi:tetratricopeptide (TPR) repeat protein
VRLSLAMIVKDEAVRLPHCLTSVAGLVDEMVIVDTGSSDGTVDLARGAGATLLSFPWVDDFSAARNAGLAACTGEWLLVLDADEAIDASDHAAIRGALSREDAQAYRLWMRDYVRTGALLGTERPLVRNDERQGEGSGFSHLDLSRRLRLFRAQGGPVFEGRVHELADGYFEARGLPVLDLEAAIHHFGKVDLDQDLVKQAGYLRLAQREATDHPRDPRTHWNVLQEALRLEDWPVALRAAEAFLGLSPGAPALVYLGAARALAALQRPGEALTYLESVLRVQPDHAPALSLRAEGLWALGRLPEAGELWAHAMAADPAFTGSFLGAAQLQASQGDLALARRCLEAGLDQNPRDLRLWEALVGLSARHEPAEAARDAWHALQAVPDGGGGIWHQIVVQALLAQEDPVGARHVLELGRAAFPGNLELEALSRRLGR